MSVSIRTLTLVALTASASGCVRDYINDKIEAGVDAAFTNTISSEEARRKVEALAADMRAKSPQTLGPSASKRPKLAPGQWVAYTNRRTKAGKNLELVRLFVRQVNGSRVTIEINEWDARDDAVLNAWAIEVDSVPLTPKLVMAPADVAKIEQQIKILSFTKLEEDGTVKVERYDQKNMSNGWYAISQTAGKMLMGHLFNRYNTQDQAPAACASAAVRSSSCIAYYGEYKTIIGTQEPEHVYAHGGVPIAGLVKASNENYDIELIAFGSNGKTRINGAPRTASR